MEVRYIYLVEFNISESGGTVYLPSGFQYIGERRYGGPSSHGCFFFESSRVTGNQIFHNLFMFKNYIIEKLKVFFLNQRFFAFLWGIPIREGKNT